MQPISDPNPLHSYFFSMHTITEEAFICLTPFITPATLPQDKARLTAVAAPHASAWLSVVPNNLGLYLSPHEWRAVTRWWIGADVNTEDSECPFCHQYQDKSGHHATVCNTNGERISRHNAIRDGIYGMASQAALSPQLEKQYTTFLELK